MLVNHSSSPYNGFIEAAAKAVEAVSPGRFARRAPCRVRRSGS